MIILPRQAQEHKTQQGKPPTKKNTACFLAVSSPMGNAEIFAAYCAAVTAALSVGLGTRALGA
eukprot:COSAG06_NODE_23264_length_697_cov_1.580268_1_plen_63_part_00